MPLPCLSASRASRVLAVTLSANPVINGEALFAAAAVLALVSGAAALTLSKEVGSRLARALSGLRVAALALLFACLFEPLAVVFSGPGETEVAVLVDRSESFSIPDAAAGGKTRAEAAAGLLGLEGRRGKGLSREALIERLSRASRVRLFAFGSELRELALRPDGRLDPRELEPVEAGTDLAGALSGALASSGAISGIVLVTDGVHTEDSDLREAASSLAASGVPVYAVAVGSSALRDVEIRSVSALRTVRKDTRLTVRAHVASRGLGSITVPVRLKELTGGRERLVAEKSVTLGERGHGKDLFVSPPREVRFEFLPEESGLKEYAVEVPVLAEEAVPENNRRVFALSVVRRKIKVLYMEGTEYKRAGRKLWEFQYLKQAVEEDPDIEVTCLLRRDVERAWEAGIYTVQDEEHGFPKTRGGLFEYDVIISSDIDIEFFTEEQLKNTVEFVARRGGGFVMIGGWTAFGPGGYDESVVDKMLPVDMTGRFDGYVENEEFRLELTEEGLRHPLMRLDPDPEGNRLIWARAPEFFGHNMVQRAKPGAAVLAVHPEERNLYGKSVIIAVQEYGRGRSMAFATDTTAGWGTAFEEEFGKDGDNRHYRRFWQVAIRWLAQYRLDAPGKLVTLEPDSVFLERGAEVRIPARVFDEDYEPARGAEVGLTVVGPGGGKEELRLKEDPSRAGLYLTQTRFERAGRYELHARARLGGKNLGEDAVVLSVGPSLKEFDRPEADRDLLRNLAELTGGKFYELDGAERLPADLLDDLHALRSRREASLWDSPAVWAAIVVLLSVEWLIRRRNGLP